MNELDLVSPFAAYIQSFITTSLPLWAAVFLAAVIHWFLLLMPPVILIQYMDRKVGADIQMRIGPNRVSVYGWLQFLSDGIKIFFKEEAAPTSQEPFLFRWGPIIAMLCLFIAVGSIPFANAWVLSNTDSGLITIICALMLSNLWNFWAAYSAESGWLVLTSYRLIALASVYLVSMVVSLIPIILVTGTMNIREIVGSQGGMPWKWIIFHNPGTFLSAIAFACSLHIWQCRAPLDFTHSSNGLLGGMQLEYSGLRKGLLSLMESISFFLSCAFIVAVYLGGGNAPFNLESFGRAANLVEWLFFMFKVLVLALLSMWIRWSLPKLRADQAIHLSWHVLLPMGLLGAIITALWSILTHGRGLGDFL